MRTFTLFFFLLFSTFSIAQENNPQKELLKEATSNHKNLNENPQKAFNSSELILKKSQKINAHQAELTAIMTQCRYYRNYLDFENMMISVNLLEQKAKKYNFPVYEASAKIYQSEIYFHNSQIQKGNAAIESALKILENSPDDSLTIISRSNVYVTLSNYASDFDSKLKYMKKSIEENKKFPSKIYNETKRYSDYTSLAIVYLDHKFDSAKYYANLSLKDIYKNEPQSNFINIDYIFLNHLVLTKVAIAEGKYEEAIQLAQKAEKIKGYKNLFNIQTMYDDVILSYQKLNDEKNATIYKAKKDSVEILITQNKNQYLLRALKENEKPLFDKTSAALISISVIFLGIILYLILRRILKKKKVIFIETEVNVSQNDYSNLIENLKTKDKAFMANFVEAFPDFSQKLLTINPKLVQSEIEFCALLKLKIHTKDIAIYKNIEVKTVRNKKYLIRKKLDIPDGVDIYQWFEEF